MTAAAVPFIFAPNTTIQSAQVNSDFAQVIADLNAIDGGQITTGTIPFARLPAPTNSQNGLTPSNPAGTLSSIDVMAGLNNGISMITPAQTGRVLIAISGSGSNNLSGQGFTVDLRYGLGNGPANGAAATGTIASAAPGGGNPTGVTNLPFPFAIINVLVGLTLAQPYWLDLGFKSTGGGGGTASLANITMVAVEL